MHSTQQSSIIYVVCYLRWIHFEIERYCCCNFDDLYTSDCSSDDGAWKNHLMTEERPFPYQLCNSLTYRVWIVGQVPVNDKLQEIDKCDLCDNRSGCIVVLAWLPTYPRYNMISSEQVVQVRQTWAIWPLALLAIHHYSFSLTTTSHDGGLSLSTLVKAAYLHIFNR